MSQASAVPTAPSASAVSSGVPALPRGAGPTYRRREVERTTLYQVVCDHVESFYAAVEEGSVSAPLPAFVRKEFEDYLDCGVLCRGAALSTCAPGTLTPSSYWRSLTRWGQRPATWSRRLSSLPFEARRVFVCGCDRRSVTRGSRGHRTQATRAMLKRLPKGSNPVGDARKAPLPGAELPKPRRDSGNRCAQFLSTAGSASEAPSPLAGAHSEPESTHQFC